MELSRAKLRSERAKLRAQRAKIRPETAELRLRWPKGGDGRTERRKDRHLEIPPCVLQDMGPLRLLPKNNCYRESF